MKISIELTDTEVKGLKAYLKAISNDITPTISKKNIETEIKGAVSEYLQCSVVYDYISKFENKSK